MAAACGAALAIACILAFALVGHGTPAPFDPPRRLVVSGPYHLVRNPLYVAAVLALSGSAMFWQSAALLAFAGLFFVTSHLVVVLYEEPALRRTFGDAYMAYCRRTGRWWPRRRAGPE